MTTLACTSCKNVLGGEFFNIDEPGRCDSCGALIRADVFPAFFREQAGGAAGETILLEDEAGCYYHPRKKAVVACEACGRFLCALCDVEFNDEHLCPSCLESGKKKRKIKNLENHRILYDNAALSLAVLPLLFFFATILTAPIVIFIVIRYWKAPGSVIPRTRFRFILAFVIALLQIAGWSLFFYQLIIH